VLDIDETSLSNYEEMAGADFGYDAKAFNDWIESAKAPAIQGTLNIYREARRLGVFVFFITGRDESQRAATEKNLKSQGFQKWERLIMRTPEQKSETALKYKSGVRSGLNGEGFQIVLSVGDQWSDLGGKPEAELSVKYPDPFYFIQ
jgi:acid phosphatase